MLEIQKHIYNYSRKLEYDIRGDYIKFDYSEDLVGYLKEKKFEYEKIRDQEIHIKYEEIGFTIFKNVKDYLTISNLKKDLNLLILSFSGKSLSYISNQAYLDFEPKNNFFFFSNASNYVEFIDFLKSKDKETEDAFHFIDYANDVNRKIVLTSITEKSRIILNYYKEIAEMPNDKDFSKGLFLFKKCFEVDNYNLPKFLKSSLIKFSSRFEVENRTSLVFQNLESIVEEAKINFEIYINNLSIDKIIKDYDEYKSKYFSEVSDVLRKVSQQIIGFPIVIASTLFAIEKVKSNEIYLSVLAFVVFITTIYLSIILKMNFRDLKYVDELSKKDYETIASNNFFNNFPKELIFFKRIKGRISTRIKNLLLICESYFWLQTISNTILIGLMLKQLNVPDGGIILIGLVIILIMTFVRNKTWDDERIEELS